jgi:hypothetical protein
LGLIILPGGTDDNLGADSQGLKKSLPVFVPVLFKDQAEIPDWRRAIRELGMEGVDPFFEVYQMITSPFVFWQIGLELRKPLAFKGSFFLKGTLAGFLKDDRPAGLAYLRGNR